MKTLLTIILFATSSMAMADDNDQQFVRNMENIRAQGEAREMEMQQQNLQDQQLRQQQQIQQMQDQQQIQQYQPQQNQGRHNGGNPMFQLRD